MSTDSNIEAAVNNELASDPLLDAKDIVVEVNGGAVSLTGTVPSQAQHAEAATAARRVAGVTAVDAMLAVALPADDYGDDAALARVANKALAATAAVPDSVKAIARNGNLFLTGTVSRSGQRDAAQDAAAGVAGVRSITNEIDVLGNT
jgi:osmotically-inducible protein OsmY